MNYKSAVKVSLSIISLEDNTIPFAAVLGNVFWLVWYVARYVDFFCIASLKDYQASLRLECILLGSAAILIGDRFQKKKLFLSLVAGFDSLFYEFSKIDYDSC